MQILSNFIDLDKKLQNNCLLYRLRHRRERTPTSLLYNQGSRALSSDRFCPRFRDRGLDDRADGDVQHAVPGERNEPGGSVHRERANFTGLVLGCILQVNIKYLFE